MPWLSPTTIGLVFGALLGAQQTPTIRVPVRVVTVPTLVMNGGASYPFMHDTARALSQAMPHAEFRTLERQRHDVDLDVLAPVLMEFFSG